jgi:hypothetical protein
MTVTQSCKGRSLTTRLLRWLLGVLLLMTLLIILLPALVSTFAAGWLDSWALRNGLDGAEIADIRLSLWHGSLDMEGLVVRKDDKPLVSIPHGHLRTRPMALLEQALPVPLETAIDLITEKDGSIPLTLNFSGDVDKPALGVDFDLGAAIGRALGDITQTAIVVINPLTLLLFELTSDPGEEPIEPVLFAPHSAAGLPDAPCRSHRFAPSFPTAGQGLCAGADGVAGR